MKGITIRYLSGHDVAARLRLRQQTPGDGVATLIEYFDALVPAVKRDRSAAPDIETIIGHFDNPDFVKLTR